MEATDKAFTSRLLQNFGTASIENTIEYKALTNKQETSLSYERSNEQVTTKKVHKIQNESDVSGRPIQS